MQKVEKHTGGSDVSPAPIGPLPLVASVLIAPQSSGEVEGAVRGQPGVHPLGEVEDLGRRERFPVALLPLQPALTAAGRALLPTPGRGGGGGEAVE